MPHLRPSASAHAALAPFAPARVSAQSAPPWAPAVPTSPSRAAFSTRAVIDSSVTLCRLSSWEKAEETCGGEGTQERLEH